MMENQLGKLSRLLKSLNEEDEISRLEPAEMQKRMLAKVKADNKQSGEMDEIIKSLKADKTRANQTLEELAQDLSDRNNGKEKNKYEKLYQRDREMTEFIDGFEEEKKNIVGDQDMTQQNIVGLLEHISLGLEHEGSMPTRDQLKKMTDEASFKERQLGTSQATMERLRSEHKQKLIEIQKIETLDDKISNELKSLHQKMTSMRGEVTVFEDIDSMHQEASECKTYLEKQLDSYTRRAKTTKEQVKALHVQYEGLKKKLEGNDTHTRLDGLEKKLRNYAQNTFQLQEFVEVKSRQTDYDTLKGNSLAMVTQLNSRIQERMSKEVQNLSEAPLSMQQWS